MTKDRWQLISAIAREAVQIDDETERTAFVRKRCGDDQSLFEDVTRLLARMQRQEAFLGMVSPGQTQFLHYAITAKIAQSAMGNVFKALDTKLHRTVVLKMLPAWCLADENARAAFLREARCASAIKHVNVVTIYGVEYVDTFDVMVMEYLDGQTLDQVIAAGLSLEQAIDLGIQIASGLAAAHSKGVVHRDIKPSNIIITDDHVAKIVDFGLAQFLSNHDELGGTAILGTRHYMAPEQAMGAPVDHRGDIYSFGRLFYEMLTGQRPFTTLLSFPAGVPVELQRLLHRCLKEETEHRLGSMHEVVEKLKQIQSGHARPAATSPNGARPPRKRAYLAGAVGAAALFAGVYLVNRMTENAPPSQSNFADAPSVVNAAASDPTYDAGLRLMNERKYEPALVQFDRVLRADPNHDQARYNRAVCLQNLHRFEEAISAFSQYLQQTSARAQRDPNDWRMAHYNRAMCYMNLGKHRETLADLTAAINLHPTKAAYLNRSKVRAALGDRKGALEDERDAAKMPE